MVTFFLVRHASYSEKYNLMPGRLPVELSGEGVKEAQKLKKYFDDKNIYLIFSSAVLRCKQTAVIISGGKIPIEYDSRLLEAWSAYQGYWQPSAWDKYWGYRRVLGGESRKEVYERSVDFFRSTKFEDGKNYLICSHMDPLYFIYQYVTNAEPLREVEIGDTVFENSECQPRASVRIITKVENDYKADKIITLENL